MNLQYHHWQKSFLLIYFQLSSPSYCLCLGQYCRASCCRDVSHYFYCCSCVIIPLLSLATWLLLLLVLSSAVLFKHCSDPLRFIRTRDQNTKSTHMQYCPSGSVSFHQSEERLERRILGFQSSPGMYQLLDLGK